HSTDSTSVMYATLNTGTVNRSLTTADLNVADSDTTGACGLHLAPASPSAVGFSITPFSSLGVSNDCNQNLQSSSSAEVREGGLSAVLADWPSALNLLGQATSQLNAEKASLNHSSLSRIEELDDFWSSFADGIALDGMSELCA